LHCKENTIDKSTIWPCRRIDICIMQAHNRQPMDLTTPPATVCSVAVTMERRTLTGNRWQTLQWEARGVACDAAPAGSAEQTIVCDEKCTWIVFPGHEIRLFRDEAEGYLFNITSPEPKVFVLWRMHDDEVARPERVTVSYHEGARWMDSDERVDGVPLPAELVPWIREFATQHYKPEPKKQKRYASNKDKGRMGRID
jgi:hypothetical protein